MALKFIVLISLCITSTTAYRTCLDLKNEGHHTSGIYQIKLPSGCYKVYCEMGINGGGYAFIPPSIISQLQPSDLFYLLNKKDLVSDVLLRISRPDGTQPFTIIKQFTDTGGISVLLTNFENYTRPENTHLGEYIFLGVTPAANARNNNVQGFLANNVPITFRNCDSNPNAYFVFYPNNKELTPNGRFQVAGISETWRQNAARPPSGRRMPLEYFLFTEMHFGGCGSYSSSDRWLTAHSPALATAIGLR